MSLRPILVPLSASAVLALACAGGGKPADSADTSDTAAPANPRDVRGVYDVTWSDVFTVTLDFGGVSQTATSDGSDVVTFNGPDGEPLELDVGAWCADPSVNCPSEAWPTQLAIDQDSPELEADASVLHAYDAVSPGARVDGLVTHADHRFLFGLDGGSGSSGSCGAVAISLAGGVFTLDGDAVNGISEGTVAVGWLGVCAWDGLAVAATLSVSTTFVATRVSDLPAPADSGDTGDTGDSGDSGA